MSYVTASLLFRRSLRFLVCLMLALTMLVPASGACAADQKADSGSLKPIHTYELLDMLADDHGKVILVNFFASFCGPCRREIPELMQLRREISEKDLVIVGIAIDQDIREAEDFVKSLGVQEVYPVFYGGEELARSYRIDAIPFNVIYNRQGRIEVSEAGYVPSEDMKNFLMELIRR